jgi:hypothetical protein
MTSLSEQELAETEVLLRQQLGRLASHAPTAVRLPDEIAVVADRRPTRRGRRAGVIAAVTALIGAGGFTTYSFLGASNDGGAATPEEAVTTFVSAMEQEDILGMIDVTLPEEVDAMRAAVDSISSDAKRIDLLADDFNSGGVQGVDISVDDLALETNFLEEGLALVTATSGTINASFDPAAFRFGGQLQPLLDDSPRVSTASADLATPTSPATIMTVERDGRWYVSVEYSIAEFIRQSNDWELPAPVSRTPVGFDSPESAVTGFYDRLATLDLQAAMDTFAPGEDAMAWLAQAWMADAQSAMEQARADGWAVSISNLTYDTIGDGDQLTLRPATFTVQGTAAASFGQDSFGSADPSHRTVVMAYDGSGHVIIPAGDQVPETIEGLSFSEGFPLGDEAFNFTNSNEDGTINPLDFPAEPTGEPQTFTVERADGCTTATGTIVSAMYGPDLPPTATPVDDGFRLCGGGNQILSGLTLLISGSALELPAISVVQTGGQWYVSPLGTILGGATLNLHDIVDGASLFDTPLAPFIYGGLSRGTLELMVKGQSERSFDPACLPALTIEGGLATGVVADPPIDAIRACNGTVSFSEESSSGSSSEPAVVEASITPESTSPPASTP